MRLPFPTDGTNNGHQNVLQGQQTGDAAILIKHDRHTPALPLHGFEELQKIHALGHERRKLHCHKQVGVGIEQEGPSVQHTHHIVGRFIVQRDPVVTRFPGLRYHLVHGQIIPKQHHPGPRLHHISSGALIEREHLQQNLFFSSAQRSLLMGQFNEIGIFVVRLTCLDFGGLGHQALHDSVHPGLRNLSHRPSETNKEPQRFSDSQGPDLWAPNAQCFGSHLARQQQQEKTQGRPPDSGNPRIERQPTPHGQGHQKRVGQRVA